MPKNSKFTAEKRQGSPVRKAQSRRGRTTPAAAPVPQKKKHAPAKSSACPAELVRPKTDTTAFIFYTNPTLALVCLPPDAPVLFSLGDAADLTGVHPDLIRYYGRTGLIEVRRGKSESELLFDENALHEIRRIEHYRRQLGIGRRALPLIFQLRREGERQQIELQFLRYP